MDNAEPTEPDDVIIDRRELRFSPVALKRMVDWSVDSAASHGLPPISPDRVALLPHAHRVDLVYDLEPPEWSFPLQIEALGKLLIAYCLHARIPMPRVAHKEVRLGARYVALVFLVKHPNSPPPKAIETSDAQQGSARPRH